MDFKANDFIELTVDGKPAIKLADGRVLPVLGGGVGEPAAPASSEGDAGGGATPEADLKAAEEALAAAGEVDDGEGEGEGEAEGDKKPSRLQSRIKRLIDQRKAYEKYGKPEEVERRLAKLREYEELESRAARAQREQEEQARVDSGAAARTARLKGLIDEAYGAGASDEFEASMRRSRETEQRINAQHANSARTVLSEVLVENAINPTPQVMTAFEHMMATYLGENDDLREKYLNPSTQKEAIDDAFSFLRANMIDPVLATAGAGTLAAIAARKSRALGSGRGSSSAAEITSESPPKDMKDPDQRAAWHKARASRAWDLAIEADEASAGS